MAMAMAMAMATWFPAAKKKKKEKKIILAPAPSPAHNTQRFRLRRFPAMGGILPPSSNQKGWRMRDEQEGKQKARNEKRKGKEKM